MICISNGYETFDILRITVIMVCISCFIWISSIWMFFDKFNSHSLRLSLKQKWYQSSLDTKSGCCVMRIQPTTLIQNWINSKKELKNDHIRIKTMKYFFSPDHDNMHTYSLQKNTNNNSSDILSNPLRLLLLCKIISTSWEFW